MKWFQDITPVQDISAERIWVIGDLHGCYDQFLNILLEIPARPDTEAVILVGDICDRGPRSLDTLRSVMRLYEHDKAYIPIYCVLGNHDAKLLRALNGANVKFTNGLEATWAEVIAYCDEEEKQKIRTFFQSTPLTICVHTSRGNCVIVHAGFCEQMMGYKGPWNKGMTVEYAIFGPTDGVLANGFPNRIPWEDTYNGEPYVFYGHKVMGSNPKFTAKTCGLDTGCWESGILTAVSYPDLKVIQSNQ